MRARFTFGGHTVSGLVLSAGFVVAVLLAACDGATSAPVPSDLAEPSLSATVAASAAAGVERMCEAFDIVNDDVSTAYNDLAEDASDIGLGFAGLQIATAGEDIEDLAEGVEPVQLAAAIREMGRLYVVEGLAVTDGNVGGMDATNYYLEMLDRYGTECP